MTTARHPGRDRIRLSLMDLVDRFLPDVAEGLALTYVLHIGDQTPMAMHIRDGRCLIAAHTPAAGAEVVLRADTDTWLDLADGRVDGIAAFLAGRLQVEGDLDLAARFETLFRPAPGATRDIRSQRTRTRGVTLDAIVAGEGTPVVLLHGLGATKVSFLPTLDGLADHYEVHALDLPGCGRSGKPVPTGRRYSMPWFAEVVHGYLVANELRAVHVIGNSMGARIALELALNRPRSVRSVTALAPAVGFDETRRLAPLLRLLRPQWLGLAPAPVPAGSIERLVRELFHAPEALPAQNLEAAAADVRRALKDPGYRLALYASARQLGLERSRGRRAYWTRLAAAIPPSLWVFGAQDPLVGAHYAGRVRESLPAADVQVWEGVGHVPQFEVPERTNTTLLSWLDRVDAGR